MQRIVEGPGESITVSLTPIADAAPEPQAGGARISLRPPPSSATLDPGEAGSGSWGARACTPDAMAPPRREPAAAARADNLCVPRERIEYGAKIMEVSSEGPLRAGAFVFRSASGALTLTVVGKATFVLTPRVSPFVTTAADAVAVHDVHWGDDPRRSLRCASDLVPFKRYPEVLVTGCAYAPSGRALTSLVARVAVAEVDKAIEVRGDRHIDLRGNLSEPAPWTRMPLCWERAAGGPGTSNPVGVPTGPDARPGPRGRIPLPNLCPPWMAEQSLRDVIPPVGLGPQPPDWPDRRSRLHGSAAAWDARAQPITLPEGLDPAYFNAAPADQHMACLTGDEAIVLESLHPEHARLGTRLEPISPVATLALGSSGAFDVPMVCDTLWIDTDRGIATLTYRGHVHIVDPDQPGTVIIRLQGRASPASARAPAVREPAIAPVDDVEVVTTVVLADDDLISHEDVETTLTITGSHAALDALLPFVPAAAPPHPTGVAPAEPQPTTLITLGERLVSSMPTLAQTLHARVALAPEAPSPPPPEPFVPPPTPDLVPPAPPQVIDPPPLIEPSGKGEAPPVAPSPEPPAGPAPLPLEDYPLERCAAIRASLERRPDDSRAILEAEALDEALWGRLSGHWQSAVDRELARHKNGLLRAYDAAYVGRLEQERGPIAAAEYALLAAAAEASDTQPALAELSLPPEAWPRIRRVWIARVAKDPRLAAIVRSLMDQEPRHHGAP